MHNLKVNTPGCSLQRIGILVQLIVARSMSCQFLITHPGLILLRTGMCPQALALGITMSLKPHVRMRERRTGAVECFLHCRIGQCRHLNRRASRDESVGSRTRRARQKHTPDTVPHFLSKPQRATQFSPKNLTSRGCTEIGRNIVLPSEGQCP
jgi:hypothetical protein